jgi:hypothetical protein
MTEGWQLILAASAAFVSGIALGVAACLGWVVIGFGKALAQATGK